MLVLRYFYSTEVSEENQGTLGIGARARIG